MRARSFCAAAISAGALVVCGFFTSASALPQPSESTLVITAYDSTSPGWLIVNEVTLKCDPASGSHVTAEDACATLDSVDGRFEELDPLLVACPLYYQPVTIEVGGNWRDRVVSFDEEYPNICVAMAESDGVFRFQPD